MTATLTQTTLTVDGLRSPMLQAGPAKATEAVVFVHGNPGSSQDWARLVERTGAFARAVAWDHPGFGRADKPAGFDYAVQGYAAHLGRCLEVLGITRVHLVLHDFGGPGAWPGRPPTPTPSPARRCSTSGSCPATAGTTWPGSGAPRCSASCSTRPPPGPGSGCCCATATRAGCPGRSSTACTPTWTAAPSGPSWPCTGPPTTRPATASGWVRRCGRWTVRPWSSGAGTTHTYRSPWPARQREAFPSARVEVLDGSGHWPFADDPERTERLVLEFLGELVGDRPRAAAG